MAQGRRQSTFDLEDDDPLSGLGEDEPNGKAASSTQSRKAQNRQAQREFRLRKQQYVRDLEARVEVLSGDKEERVELMVLLLRNLLKENKELRGMVKSMASFVGEGLGSCLPRLGLSAPQLEAILNRADTDTAYEAFINLKASKELEEANPGIELGAVRRKERNASSKRKRSTVDSEGPPTGESSGNPGSADSHPPPIQTNGETKPNIGDLNGLDQYGYLFPDLQAFAQHPPPPPGQAMPQFSPIWPLTPGYFNSLFGPGQSPQTSNSMGNFMAPSLYPVPGQPGPMQTPGGATGPNPAEYMSGFGLTLPPSQPISSFAGGTRADGGDYAVKHPPEPPRATDISRSGSGSKPNTPQSGKKVHPPAPVHPPEIVEEMDRQRRLREAVAKLSEGKSRRESDADMTPAEVAERASIHAEMQKALKENHMDERAAEAMQLTSYHLSNYRLNHSYVLPPSLKPTPLQRTIPHEYVIDGLPFPSMRDRMILLRGQYDLVSALTDIVMSFSVHGEDVLNHESWEIGEDWIKKYSFLVDDTILAITNKWRATRGDRAIVLPVVPDVGGGGSGGVSGGSGGGSSATTAAPWMPRP